MRMRSLIWTAAMAVIGFGPSSARAQDAFEGVVTFRMNAGPQGAQDVRYSVKGDQVRTDMSTGGMNAFMIYNTATRTMDFVMPERQMYMESSVPKPPAAAEAAPGPSKVTWTGQKETIAGHACEHATVQDSKGQTVDVCLAKGMGTFMQMGGGMGGRASAPGWEGEIGQMFPLKVTRAGTVELEVTSIDRKTLDPSVFTIPAGFNKMSMPGRGGSGR